MTAPARQLDPDFFPRLTNYLAYLPAGLDSHPKCQVKTGVLRPFYHSRPLSPEQLALLPEPLQRSLARVEDECWMPEAHFMAAALAIADAARFSEEELDRWALALNRELLGGRVYKVLMSMASPDLLLPISRFKWSTLRRGTTFEVDVLRKGCRATVRFPERLFDAACLKLFAPAFAAILEVSNARNPKIELERFDETSGSYIGHWD
jgi:hypothetical protein